MVDHMRLCIVQYSKDVIRYLLTTIILAGFLMTTVVGIYAMHMEISSGHDCIFAVLRGGAVCGARDVRSFAPELSWHLEVWHSVVSVSLSSTLFVLFVLLFSVFVALPVSVPVGRTTIFSRLYWDLSLGLFQRGIWSVVATRAPPH